LECDRHTNNRQRAVSRRAVRQPARPSGATALLDSAMVQAAVYDAVQGWGVFDRHNGDFVAGVDAE